MLIHAEELSEESCEKVLPGKKNKRYYLENINRALENQKHNLFKIKVFKKYYYSKLAFTFFYLYCVFKISVISYMRSATMSSNGSLGWPSAGRQQ